jgi:hypothetical protein
MTRANVAGEHDDEKRVQRLEARVRPAEPVFPIVILDQSQLEPVVWDELRTLDAVGDTARLADLIERVTGTRPKFGGAHVTVIWDVAPRGELAPCA